MTIWCKLVNWNQSHRATIFTRRYKITKFHAWAFSQQDYSVFWFIYHGLKKLLHEPVIDMKTFRPANCHSFGQPGSQRSIKISYKIQAFGILILNTAQSCSTAGEVISTSFYCKHWSYSPGEWSELHLAQLVSTSLEQVGQGLTPCKYKCTTNESTIQNILISGLAGSRANQYATVAFVWMGK